VAEIVTGVTGAVSPEEENVQPITTLCKLLHLKVNYPRQVQDNRRPG
jgi:hypothetical protein